MNAQSLKRFAWVTVLYNLLVIAWGVFVRASGSGDGCGSHWPLCDGDVLPPFGSQAQKWIEFSHRMTSGLVLPLVLVLIYSVFRMFPRGHVARKMAAGAVFMTLLEALIGAALVKFGWVDQDDSAARAGVMAFHVVSTFILVGFLTATALLIGGAPKFSFKNQGALGFAVGLAYLMLAFLGVSGAVSALGHTLKPVENVLASAIQHDTHWMVRLQPLHPLIATSIGLYLLLLGGLLVHLRPAESVKKSVRLMLTVYAIEMALGAASIFLKAPIPMQMVHLVLADICFMALVATTMSAFGEAVPRREMTGTMDDLPTPEPLKGFGATIKAYLVLTKPRVISLLLFTTLTAMVIAERGWPNGWLVLAVAIGGYMSAGAANAINMVIDRDIDATMKRTAKRPTVTQAIPTTHAMYFGFALAILSFALLWAAANLLTAVMALCGLVFYIVVYTLLLKRRTWHNIVIGGAAGAFPPMVGYSAITNELTPFAWILFGVIFLWTPVHFWALAILIKDDYAKAGVPMLPVVHGEKVTVIQIAGYTVLTAIASALPLYQSSVGSIYLVSAVALNSLLIVRAVQLYKLPERPQALGLYKYSMVYLALLFLVLAIDRSIVS